MANGGFTIRKPKKTPQTLFTFPPHRRRPLKSATFCTLVRIISHCYDESHRSHHQFQAVSEQPKLDNCGVEIGQVAEHDESVVRNHIESLDLLVQKESPVDANKEDIGCEKGGFTNAKNMEIDVGDYITEGNEELAHLVNSLGDKNQSNSNGSVPFIDNQEDQFSFPDFPMEEFGPTGQLEVDKEFSIHEVCEAIDISLDVDMTAGSSNPIVNKEENSAPVEMIRGEVQWKGMELENLVSGSGALNSALHLTADEGIEEGEIPGDVGVYGESMGFLLEDDVSLEEKRVDKIQISEDIFYKEEITGNEHQRGLEMIANSMPVSVDTVDNVGSGMEVELRENNRNLVGDKSELVVPGDIIEARRAEGYGCRLEMGRNRKQLSRANEFDSGAACLENPAVRGGSLGEIATENQVTASAETDADFHNKKKKRGPPTKEKRAKKKKKERIKRAENNRKLGVKRLKLQPVLKPKTVKYCRHYLKGRCQEGEKCKFSHDTVPLTKSKPCCHFARHSCMKGDDCPFDHKLSNYPCHNYLSKGSCSRDADCMFSHEIPVKEGSPIASNVSKPEVKPGSLLGNSNFKKQLCVNGISQQNVNAKSRSIGMFPCKSTEHSGVETIPNPSAQAPKGISFLLQGKFSPSDTTNLKQAGLSPKADNVVKVGHQMIHIASDVVKSSNEITKRAPTVAPQGINFLSFGKAPLDDSSSKISFSFPFHRDHGTGKSLLSDSSKSEQAGSSAKRNDGVKVDNQTGKSASNMVRNLNEMANRTPPAVAPRGIQFFSFGKAQSDDSRNMKQAKLHCNDDNAVPPSVLERERALDKLPIPNAFPWRLSSSSLSCGQSLDRLADGQSKSTLSSSQKSFLSNTPSSVQKALCSTLAFAAKFKSEVKPGLSIGALTGSTDFSKGAGSSQSKSMKASTILDFVYGDRSGRTL